MVLLQLTFKVSGGGQTFDLSVENDITVADLKIASAGPSGVSSSRMIYKGKVLKDTDILSQLGLENGHTIHIVKAPSAKPADSTEVSASVAATNMSPFPAAPSSTPAAPPNSRPAGGVPQAAPLGRPPFVPFPGAHQSNPINSVPANPASGFANAGFPGGMDPNMMATMMQSPMFQQMYSAMAANPQLMTQMMQSNPMMQQMIAQNPQVAHLMQNPELLRVLMNPQTMQALMQFQQAMSHLPPQPTTTNNTQPQQQLQNAAPGGVPGNVDYNAMLQALSTNPALAQMMMGDGSGEYPVPGGEGGGAEVAAGLQEEVGRLEQRYASELVMMEGMGFEDRLANIEALRVCDGNVELAVNFLLSGGARWGQQ